MASPTSSSSPSSAWPQRRRLIGLSTKMYFSLSRTRDFTRQLLSLLGSIAPASLAEIDIFIIPDFVSLTSTAAQLASCAVPVLLGAQDCHWQDSGAFTGEVSAAVLHEAGVGLVEVGHAERRRLFGEDDAMVAKKAAAVVSNAMVPLVCIGEQTPGDVASAVAQCRLQVEAVMAAVPDDAPLVLAYEPVWAIGATRPAEPQHVVAVAQAIRQLECVTARRTPTRILYGGSAGPGLFQQLSGSLDGLFLGRFGHEPARFVDTIRDVVEA
ncbi:hypothetical protein CDD81_2357 [Ophiocordyceps australis]|uniref:Triosephosphate isomerase n=1 Tax=Ophiocordyceps australis TaxID=1399860 RepID=A0A2C5XES2_9HYPO|nr:hypothetical protein CDD81_2357 [Ophiocordyceps australis]